MTSKAIILSALAGSLIACGGDSGTNPNPNPTPTPAPIPAPTPTPLPQNLQAETYCVPEPPPLHNLRVKVHSNQGWKKLLDSRALVQSADWCSSIGYPGDICVVRNEEDPQAVTCNNLVMGKAKDTGRYGPTWYWNGEPCRPINEGSGDGCRNHESNQFLAYAFGPGDYVACGANGVCNGITIK